MRNFWMNIPYEKTRNSKTFTTYPDLRDPADRRRNLSGAIPDGIRRANGAASRPVHAG